MQNKRLSINPNEHPLTKRDQINQKYKIIRTAKVGISIINQKEIQKTNITSHSIDLYHSFSR
jgi:hypothetical protein